MNFDISSISLGYQNGELKPKDIANQVEAMFMELLIESMENSVEAEGGLYGDSASSEIYRGLFRQELAIALSSDLETPLRYQLEEAIARASSEAGSPEAGAYGTTTPATVSPTVSGEVGGRAAEGMLAPGRTLPVDGRITSVPGWREDPITGERRHHDGIDIAAPEGTPVRATETGRVVESGPRGSYGNTVVVETSNGRRMLYAHNQVNTVRVGDVVRAGDVIALVGSTGRSTGPHVHFEVTE